MLNGIEPFLIRNIVVPLWARREGTPYLAYLKSLQSKQFISGSEMQRDREDKLSRLLKHAYKNCPYYSESFAKLGLVPEDIKTPNDLSKLPVLTKNDVRLNKNKMLSSNIQHDKLILKKTSGSTGVSLELYMDTGCSEWRRAVTVFRNEWSGWRLGERTAAIWGNPPSNKNWRSALRNSLIERHIYLDSLDITESAMLKFLEYIKILKPTLLFGHAHSLYLFAQFLKKNALSKDMNFKGVISTAMILYEWQRAAIEEVFNCKVFNRYGCEEVSLIASECEKHEGLHINTDSLFVEFIKDGRPALPGEEASVVITDLMNYGMPFIRYLINDVAIFTNKRCPCGRQSLLIEKVIGRDADYVLTPEGKLISGISLTENFSLKVPGVEQMQIEQDKLAHLKIRIVRDDNFNQESEKKLFSLSKELFGHEMQLEYQYVSHIPQEKSGKYRFVISNISQ